MKKLIYLTSAIVLSTLLFLSSCVKYEQSTPFVINDSITGTIKGMVYANLDQSNSELETAPSSTKIYFQVDNDEYLPGTEGSKVYTATVGSDGSYSITIPTTNDGVTVKIFADDFEYNQVQWDGSTTQRTVFTLPNDYVTVTANQTKIEDLYFND